MHALNTRARENVNKEVLTVMYYVAQNKATGRLVAGTDWRYHPPHQIYADALHPPVLWSANLMVTDPELRARGIKPERFRLRAVEIEVLDPARAVSFDTPTRVGAEANA